MRRLRQRFNLGFASLLVLSSTACLSPTDDAAIAPQDIAPTQANERTPPPPPPPPAPAVEPGVRAEAVAEPLPVGDSAADAAQAFYRMHLQLNASGLPVGEDLARYQPMLSRRLLALMAPAARERDRSIAQAPGAKPPYVDEDLFTSMYDGATTFKLGKRSVIAADRESFEIDFSYTEASGTSRWTDRVQMLREDGRWKLDDVEYGGYHDDWTDAGSVGGRDHDRERNFAVRGRLSDTLKQSE
ncbi:DUF3828 domain-containing protein [Lysobacter sp. Root690]|uniref:DUF3828 domain-containing protein n=1 Tax=Lysobacter sp. Root690 TaxID=1736588 RepID=UPI0006FC6F37|nr:DUF3828 domain-containing protein [Lysobacter sp. Root690]KRB06166.1 hypothetical protein ASD86_15420 [Lysobacter sp. Root690]